ncbi:MAG: inositol-3-phosphate synthase [Rickettsiaceae bacterium]
MVKRKKKIPVCIIGIGNCASSLIQGIGYYEAGNSYVGLLNHSIAGYKPGDIEVVAAFDIDKRKVGKSLKEAVFSKPNNTKVFFEDIDSDVIVSMGRILDGYDGDNMKNFDNEESIVLSEEKDLNKDQVVQILRDSGAEVLINYLPVGSEKATEFYMECALEARVGVVNCIPCFIASNPKWNERFLSYGIPIIGDDIKAQIGATIAHRTLSQLFEARGVKIENTYQLNFGGNLDFLNMTNRSRLKSKKISKTAAVQSVLQEELESNQIHIGPSDYVPWLKDNKVCYLRMEGRIFGNVPIDLELRLSVEDSPNSAGIVIDAIRCCKIALQKNEGGAIVPVSSYLMKHPPKQYHDNVAKKMMDEYINMNNLEEK